MAKYNWRTSKDAFYTFKLIYEFGGSTLSQLADYLKLDKSTVAQHISGFKKAGLINASYKNREKKYSVDKAALKNAIRAKPKQEIYGLIMTTSSFSDLLINVQSQNKNSSEWNKQWTKIVKEREEEITVSEEEALINEFLAKQQKMVENLKQKNLELKKENYALKRTISAMKKKFKL